MWKSGWKHKRIVEKLQNELRKQHYDDMIFVEREIFDDRKYVPDIAVLYHNKWNVYEVGSISRPDKIRYYFENSEVREFHWIGWDFEYVMPPINTIDDKLLCDMVVPFMGHGNANREKCVTWLLW